MKTCDNIRIHPHVVVIWDALLVKSGEECPLCHPVVDVSSTYKYQIDEAIRLCEEAQEAARSARKYLE